MIRELKFFIGLQLKQTNKEICINQFKYINDLFKKFEIDNLKPIRIPTPQERVE